MSRSFEELEADLEKLSHRLDRVELRLRELESQGASETSAVPAAEPVTRSEEASPRAPAGPTTPWISLIGRTLVVLGGGFLLRAVTEAEVVPRSVGTWAGLTYALVWFALADRTGAKGNGRSAVFHAVAGILIGFPLLWESTRTYDFLSPSAAIAVAVGIGMVALAVAWRRNLRTLAWLASMALGAILFSLSLVPGGLLPASVGMVLLGLVTLWIGYIRDWFGLVWFTAFLVDVVILMIALFLLAEPEAETRFGLEPLPVIAVQILALLAYLGSIVGRTLFRSRDVILLEILQTAALLLLGLGGAVFVARSGDLALMPLGLGCLLLSAAFYGVAFTVLDRRVGGKSNFIYYTSLAIVLALISGALFLERTALVFVFVALALLTRWFGLRYSRVTLAGHSVFYILAAAIWSGLLASAFNALAGSAELARWTQGPALVVLAAGLAIGGAPVSPHRRTWGALSLLPRILLFVLLVISLDGIVVALMNGLLAGEGGDPAMTATIRTVVLAVSAFLLAWIARFERSRSAAWLVYPLLVVGGLKLVFEDLPTGRPVTLFVSLAVYGGALILAPRWLRKVPRKLESSRSPEGAVEKA